MPLSRQSKDKNISTTSSVLRTKRLLSIQRTKHSWHLKSGTIHGCNVDKFQGKNLSCWQVVHHHNQVNNIRHKQLNFLKTTKKILLKPNKLPTTGFSLPCQRWSVCLHWAWSQKDYMAWLRPDLFILKYFAEGRLCYKWQCSCSDVWPPKSLKMCSQKKQFLLLPSLLLKT